MIITFQTVEEYYRREKEEYIDKPPLNLSSSDDLSSTCYDAMWTFANALKRTIAGMVYTVFYVC